MKKFGTSSRREWMKGIGLLGAGAAAASALPPIERLVEILADSMIHKAVANSKKDRFYLYVGFFGAPARWMFDHMVKTKVNQSIIANPMVATCFAEGGSQYSSAIYRTVDYKGLQVPPIWLTKVLGSSGQRNLSELLDHMIVVRGYGSGVDGHPSNCERQTRALPSLGSTGGYLAEESKRLFKAVRYPAHGTTTGFSSPLGVGMTNIHSNPSRDANLLQNLLYPYGARSGTEEIQSLRQRYNRAIQSFQLELQNALEIDPKNPVLEEYRAAQKRISDGVHQFIAEWPALFQKYESILLGTLKDRTVPAFTDKPIPVQADTGGGETGFALNINGVYQVLQEGTDLRDLLNDAQMTSIAQGFALAEFVFKHKMGSVIELPWVEVSNLKGTARRQLDQTTPYSAPQAFTGAFSTDQHGEGVMITTYLNSCVFRAYGAALIELIERLKEVEHEGKSVFDHTVIQLAQDFGRAPRSSGMGSDHGYDNMICSLITGLHSSGPQVVGNISQSQTYSSTYAGTFGFKAPVMLDGKAVTPSPIHLCSSLASLLGLSHNPWGNLAHPLFEEINGQIKFHVGAEII